MLKLGQFSARWGFVSPALASVLIIGPLSFTPGCHDDSPPPPQVTVPAASDHQEYGQLRERDAVRPLPPVSADRIDARPPFVDEPLVDQAPPEQPEFVDLYHKVGSPKITLFVNRTLEGDLIAVNRDESGTYLAPGQYDEILAKSLDYEAIENIMTDWIACQGQVTVISPTLARQRLSDQQVRELQSGRPAMLSEIAQQLGADVLIQVQAHPTRQTPLGLEVRLVAEAMNTKGGQSLARATVDMDPPLTKTQINKYTRWLARKLMSDMTGTWSAPPPPELRSGDAAPSQSAPQSGPAPAPGASSYPPEAAPFNSGTGSNSPAPTTVPTTLP
jgi:hypothetical protein